jgi:transcription elongation factor GreA
MVESADVRIGSLVSIRDDDGEAEFRIVEAHEADAIAERVSAESPLGRALLGRRVGDLVRFRAPAGVLAVTVVDVR